MISSETVAYHDQLHCVFVLLSVFQMKLFTFFYPSILIVSVCDSAALEADGSDERRSHIVSVAIARALSYLPMEMQVKISLRDSVIFNTICDEIGPSRLDEFMHELVLFNQPELDKAFGVPLDSVVASVERVVQDYIACRERPYCKYLPRGLRNDEGEEYAQTVIAEYMTQDGKLVEAIHNWGLPLSLTCFLDDFSAWRGIIRGSASFQILARADRSVIMVGRSNQFAFTIIPSARMLIRAVPSASPDRTTVELWHADSMEPQILYKGVANRRHELTVEVEISPNHERIIIFMTADVFMQTEGRFQRTYVKKVFNTDYKNHMPVFEENSNDRYWPLFEDIRELSGAEFDDHVHDRELFRPLPDRDAELLVAFRAEVSKIGYPDKEEHPQQAILRKIHRAISEPDDRLLPLIKEFLKGRAYQSSRFANAKAIEKLIQRTIAGERLLYQLSAQEFWDTSIRG